MRNVDNLSYKECNKSYRYLASELIPRPRTVMHDYDLLDMVKI